MNNIYILLFSLLTLSSCGENAIDKPKENTSALKTEKVAQAQGIPYINGITSKNAGNKIGPVHIKGSIQGSMSGKWIYLYETSGKINTKIDSVKSKDNQFDFGTKDYHRGFYALSINSINNLSKFIVNPDEPNLELIYKSQRLDASLATPGSVENKGYGEYNTKKNTIDNEISRLKKSRAESSMKEKYEKMINDKHDEFIVFGNEMIAKYPDTYFAKFVTWQRSEYKNDKNKYWDDLDFSDESLIYSMTFHERIQEYMRTHSGGTESGFLNCIDVLVEKAKINEKVLESVLYTLLDGFYSSNKEDICLYIMDNYIFGDACGDVEISNVLAQHAKGIQSLQVGNIPPDFTMDTHDDKKLNLMKEVKKNKYTLVMFWSSWCHKCEQEIPILKTTYANYHTKGFEVVGVSLDAAKQPWVKAVADKQIPWPTVSQLAMYQSPVAIDYHVTGTPTLFLLNEKGEIVSKPKRIYEVNSFLQQNLQ